jgi:hypothetical protein
MIAAAASIVSEISTTPRTSDPTPSRPRIQVGGFGVMTFASVVGLAVLRRFSLRSRLVAAAEVKSLGLENDDTEWNTPSQTASPNPYP